MILSILCCTPIVQVCLVSSQQLEMQVTFRRHHKTQEETQASLPHCEEMADVTPGYAQPVGSCLIDNGASEWPGTSAMLE